MLYRIPMDRSAFKDRLFYLDRKTDSPFCKEHGAMNAVIVVNKNGKKYVWYRCLVCHIGAVYDKNAGTNQSWVEAREMDAEGMMKKLDSSGIRFSVVGSYALMLGGYNVKPNDVDIIVEEKDLDKAKAALSGFGSEAEVYEGAPKSRVFTPEEYRELFISKFMNDDMMIEKLARHAVDEPRILALFEGTEIIFVLESMKKDIERKLAKK